MDNGTNHGNSLHADEVVEQEKVSSHTEKSASPSLLIYALLNTLRDAGLILVFISIAFIFAGILIAVVHVNPYTALQEFVRGSLGSKNGIAETLVRATPLAFAALGVSVAFRAGVWNIGAEGQIFIGALGATLVGLYLPNLPLIIHLPLVLLGGFIGGGVWGGLAGLLKARFKANEIIITIMLNYIAIFFIGYLVTGPMKDSSEMVPQPQTVPLPSSAILPRIIPFTRAHAGTLVLILVVAIVWFLMKRTSLGYELRSAGANPEAASHIGINVLGTVMIAMGISGGLAGLAGANEVSGIQGYLTRDISSGYGYLSIAVALLGGLEPLGVVLSSLFFGVVLVGTESMQRALNIPNSMVNIIQGLVIVSVLIRQFGFRRKE